MKTKEKVLVDRGPMARINTRIRPEQQAYIKELAKKTNSTEGEIFRAIINAYMLDNK